MKNTAFNYSSLTLNDAIAIIIIVLIILAFLSRSVKSDEEEEEYDPGWTVQDENYCYIEYTYDSLYTIEYDSVVRVKEARSGKLINEFPVYLNSDPYYPWLKQMEPDPTGKYLAFLDGMNIISIYNLSTGECEGTNDYYFDENHHIYFSDDGQYLLVVDYLESTVDILRLPGLEKIANAGLGFYRNNFFWENMNGKLIFYFEVADSLFKTIFPEEGHGDSLIFSKPVGVGSITSQWQNQYPRFPLIIDL